MINLEQRAHDFLARPDVPDHAVPDLEGLIGLLRATNGDLEEADLVLLALNVLVIGTRGVAPVEADHVAAVNRRLADDFIAHVYAFKAED